MKTIRRDLVIAVFVALLPALFVMACQPADQQAPTPEAQETGIPCPDPPPCGNEGQPPCANTPNEPPDCWTTEYGPAWADVQTSNTNFLYCTGGTYALCFFSGPPYATGNDSLTTDPLPCVLDGDNANCTCQVYTSASEGAPYFVLINAISNRGLYFETVNQCGSDGSGCMNLENCGADGHLPTCSGPSAPVCDYINNQTSTDPASKFNPDADLISTFSFAMETDYSYSGSVSCTSTQALYAGCMTAACNFTEGDTSESEDGAPIQCSCPTFNGPFQLTQSGQGCGPFQQDGQSYVWSAAYKPESDSTQSDSTQ